MIENTSFSLLAGFAVAVLISIYIKLSQIEKHLRNKNDIR